MTDFTAALEAPPCPLITAWTARCRAHPPLAPYVDQAIAFGERISGQWFAEFDSMTEDRALRLGCVATAMLLMLLDHMTMPHRFHAAFRPALHIALSRKPHYRAVRRDRRADRYFRDLYRTTGNHVLAARAAPNLLYGSALLLGMFAERAIWEYQPCPVPALAGHLGFSLARWAENLIAGEGAVLLSNTPLDLIAFGSHAAESDAGMEAFRTAVKGE